MKNSSVLIVVIVAILLLVAGAIYLNYLKPGSDRDSHGCIGSAGYTWCDASQKCIRPWEENCTALPQTVGNGTDSHGCNGSDGYTWCALNQKCLRAWEEKCVIFLPEGAVLNTMPADSCPAAGGHVVDVKGETACPEGEFPLAEVSSDAGARKFCCSIAAPNAPSGGNGSAAPENITAPAPTEPILQVNPSPSNTTVPQGSIPPAQPGK